MTDPNNIISAGRSSGKSLTNLAAMLDRAATNGLVDRASAQAFLEDVEAGRYVLKE